MPWSDRLKDQECIRRAIEATPGVVFKEQSAHTSSAYCIMGDCPDRKYWNWLYEVTHNQNLKDAYVRVSLSEKGIYRFQNFSVGLINEKMSDEDRAGFQKAIELVNRSIKDRCIENPRDPS